MTQLNLTKVVSVFQVYLVARYGDIDYIRAKTEDMVNEVTFFKNNRTPCETDSFIFF